MGASALKLPHREGADVDLGLDVRLEYYRLSKTGEQTIALAGEAAAAQRPDRGWYRRAGPPTGSPIHHHQGAQRRFGTEFTAADQLFFDQIEEALSPIRTLRGRPGSTPWELQVRFDTAFIDAILDRRTQNDSIFTRILDDPQFAETVKAVLLARVYDRQQTTGAP